MRFMKNIIFYILVLIILIGCNESKKEPIHHPTTKPSKEMPKEDPKKFGLKAGEKPAENPFLTSNQIMITIMPNEDEIEGKMYRFEKNGETWKSKGNPYPVNIGKNGLAWGRGGELSDNVKRGYFKQEGDGKAPAGIFTIGAAFGNATPKEMKEKNIKLPFMDVSENLYCVDDVKSDHYNKIVSTDDVSKDWGSAEEMLRKDDLYDLGIFVNHNTPTQSGDGSCIIIHIWRAKGKPTHGCTATTKENMMELLQWLDPAETPLLFQITEKEYPVFQNWFNLPQL